MLWIVCVPLIHLFWGGKKKLRKWKLHQQCAGRWQAAFCFGHCWTATLSVHLSRTFWHEGWAHWIPKALAVWTLGSVGVMITQSCANLCVQCRKRCGWERMTFTGDFSPVLFPAWDGTSCLLLGVALHSCVLDTCMFVGRKLRGGTRPYLQQEGWNLIILQVPSNPSHSMTPSCHKGDPLDTATLCGHVELRAWSLLSSNLVCKDGMATKSFVIWWHLL